MDKTIIKYLSKKNKEEFEEILQKIDNDKSFDHKAKIKWNTSDLILLKEKKKVSDIYKIPTNVVKKIIVVYKNAGKQFNYPTDQDNLTTHNFIKKSSSDPDYKFPVNDKVYNIKMNNIINKKLEGYDNVLSKFNKKILPKKNVDATYNVLKSNREFLCLLSKQFAKKEKRSDAVRNIITLYSWMNLSKNPGVLYKTI